MSDASFPQEPAFREDLRRAVGFFIEGAYGPDPPASARRYLLPEGDCDVLAWLMGDLAERTPPAATFEEVRTFHLRIGSRHYRHLKLRISRPGQEPTFVFTVDSHDAFLVAEPGSPDFEGLRELKRRNAEAVDRITEAWERAGLNTERNYMREKIRRARERRAEGGNGDRPGV
jgi:hypothetical protein